MIALAVVGLGLGSLLLVLDIVHNVRVTRRRRTW